MKRKQKRRVAIGLAVVILSSIAATRLVVLGNQHEEMGAIPFVVMGGALFWAVTAPALALTITIWIRHR